MKEFIAICFFLGFCYLCITSGEQETPYERLRRKEKEQRKRNKI